MRSTAQTVAGRGFVGGHAVRLIAARATRIGAHDIVPPLVGEGVLVMGRLEHGR